MPYFQPTIEQLDRDRLRALQIKKLRALLDGVWGHNPFYTAKLRAAGLAPGDIRSLADMAQLPLTTKHELLADQAQHPPFGTNLTYPQRAYVRVHQTSGTMGTPLRVLDTRESWDWWGYCWGFVLAGAGLTPDDRLFMAFGFGPFIGFWAAAEGARQIGALMIPGGGQDSRQRLEMMRALRPTALCCTPTYALRLAEVARETGLDLSDIPIRATIHAGEPGANIPATKARIQTLWGAKCFDHAGASEVGAHSFECEAQPGGIHVIESEFIVEVIEPATGQPAPDGGRGELVITNLGRVGFPVLRYRTGDIVQVNPARCACGRSLARFEGGILGRADDMVTVRGVNVFPSAVENIVRRFTGVSEFRVLIRRVCEMEEMDIEVELEEGADPAVLHHIGRETHQALSLRPNVRLVPSGTLPRPELKAHRFFVERANGASAGV
ncbi:MAG: phenylacetate--CoA ligase family protein [Anaerolineales bacterium]|nr:phenylacetate--CoA ligase family protein [Anaerolineales bacterium]